MSNLRNIGYLTSEYARASDTFIRNEVNELRRLGKDVHTFSIRRPGEINPSAEVAGEQASTLYLLEHPLLMILATVRVVLTCPLRVLRSLKILFRLLLNHPSAPVRHLMYFCEACFLTEQLRIRKIQWLHNHIAENSAAVALLTSLLSKIPYSLTVHGPGIFFHPRQQSLGLKIERSAFTACITEYCRSQCMIFTDSQHWHRLKIVHCAVGREFIESKVAPFAETQPWVSVGRLCPEKGHLILLQAIKLLAEEGLAPKVILIGDGEMRGDIQRFVDQHQLRENVLLLGWQSSAVITERLKASKGLVMASFAEGLPVVCMESLALGRPVIAPRLAGIPELIEHGSNGWLFTPSSVESLADAMRKSLACPQSMLIEMGADGRRRVERDHSPSIESQKLLHLIEMAGHAGRQPEYVLEESTCPSQLKVSALNKLRLNRT